MQSETVLDYGFHAVGSRFKVLDSSLRQWNLDYGVQSLVRFRISWAVFWIPKTRIPDCASKNFLDSRIQIPLHAANHLQKYLIIPCLGLNIFATACMFAAAQTTNTTAAKTVSLSILGYCLKKKTKQWTCLYHCHQIRGTLSHHLAMWKQRSPVRSLLSESLAGWFHPGASWFHIPSFCQTATALHRQHRKKTSFFQCHA